MTQGLLCEYSIYLQYFSIVLYHVCKLSNGSSQEFTNSKIVLGQGKKEETKIYYRLFFTR